MKIRDSRPTNRPSLLHLLPRAGAHVPNTFTPKSFKTCLVENRAQGRFQLSNIMRMLRLDRRAPRGCSLNSCPEATQVPDSPSLLVLKLARYSPHAHRSHMLLHPGISSPMIYLVSLKSLPLEEHCWLALSPFGN